MKRKQGERGATVSTEYIIKLDTVKEMAMLERNEKGKQIRRYFIEVEKKYKTLSQNTNTILQVPFNEVIKPYPLSLEI